MSEPEIDADILIDEIDAGLIAQSHTVARSLLACVDPEDRDLRALMTAYDAGKNIEATEWAPRIWPKIEALPPQRQGALRLGVNLFCPDGILDWEAAGYLIHWARIEGVSEADIIRAFPTPSSARLAH